MLGDDDGTTENDPKEEDYIDDIALSKLRKDGGKVSFETLLASFGLETPALLRLGALVHFLDAGGVQPPEASGIEKVLAGMHEAIADDDQLLQTSSSVFDGLLAAFEKDPQT